MNRRVDLLEERLTHSVIGSFFDVYNYYGFGLLESVYAAALEWELREKGHQVEREVLVNVWYKERQIARQRLDMVVDGKVIVEVKSAEVLPKSAERQLLSYLTASRIEIGLLLHFGPTPKFQRFIRSG